LKIVSIDLETTGIAKDLQVLQAAFIIEDSDLPEVPVEDLPTWSCFVRHPIYKGEPYALWLNGWIFKILADKKTTEKVLDFDKWEQEAESFLVEHLGKKHRYNAAGKNVASFDMHFFSPYFQNLFRHRIIDVGNIFIDWSLDGLPSMEILNKKFNIINPAEHNAVEDARNVIRLLRMSYPKKEE
jgi:oligoribonuclease (3'-5' exoribonuclease)